MDEKHWNLNDVSWDRFDASRVDPEIVKVIKAAALVEFNGYDYAIYLKNVFTDDLVFQQAADQWASEEVQHGQALGKWAQLADPQWDFDGAVERFRAGYQLNLNAAASVRGSRAGELVARCIVEVGTSSYYGSLSEHVEEPVLKNICQRITADELRHYKLFYTHLRRYLQKDGIGRVKRILIALGRINETEDDELAYAFFAANAGPEAVYDRKIYSDAYMCRAAGFYTRKHVERAVAMVCKAAGIDPKGRFPRLASAGAFRFIKAKHRRLTAAGQLAA